MATRATTKATEVTKPIAPSVVQRVKGLWRNPKGRWAILGVVIVVMLVAGLALRSGLSGGDTAPADPAARASELVLEAVDLINDARYDEGIEILGQANELDPTNSLVHYNLGVAYQFSDRLAEAVEAYTTSLSLDNRFDSAYYNRGLVLRDQGKLREAEADLKIAAALNPTNAAAHWNLGQILISLGEQAAGEASIARAREINPDIGT
jgi:tetratricopeptide (TPR) repeat protein